MSIAEATRVAPQEAPQGHNTTEAGSDPKKKRKGRAKLPPHPATGEGKPKLTAVPDDYDVSKHKMLMPVDFADNKMDVFYEFRASVLKPRIEAAHEKLDSLISSKEQYERRAEAFRRTGSFEERTKAEKLVSLQLEMERLKAQLAKTTAELIESDGEEKVKQLITEKG